jgi:hypothetical protein
VSKLSGYFLKQTTPIVNQDFKQLQPFNQHVNPFLPNVQPLNSNLKSLNAHGQTYNLNLPHNSIINSENSEMNVTYLVVTYNLQVTAVVILLVGFLIVISLLLLNMKNKAFGCFKKGNQNLQKESHHVSPEFNLNFHSIFHLVLERQYKSNQIE